MYSYFFPVRYHAPHFDRFPWQEERKFFFTFVPLVSIIFSAPSSSWTIELEGVTFTAVFVIAGIYCAIRSFDLACTPRRGVPGVPALVDTRAVPAAPLRRRGRVSAGVISRVKQAGRLLPPRQIHSRRNAKGAPP